MNRYKIIISLFIFFTSIVTLAQERVTNGTCATATVFCSDDKYEYPLTVNDEDAFDIESSITNFGCLLEAPSPNWYSIEIENPGDIIIFMESPTDNDIDFAVWGPFTDPTTPCATNLTGECTQAESFLGSDPNECPSNTSINAYPYGNLVDCSFDIASFETATIPNTKKRRILLVLSI